MGSRSLVNLVLLLLLGGLVLVVVYEPGKTPPAALPPLTTFAKTDIDRIAIGEAAETTVVMHKQNGEWRSSAPLDIKADSGRIDSLLGVVATPSHAQFAVRPEELSKYGLDKPRAWLQLNDLRIEFGGTEPVNHRRYVKLADKVHLITDLFYHHLVTEVTSWFDSALLPAGDAPVMLKLPEVTLQQQPDGSWHSNAVAPVPSADVMSAFIDNWRHARALRLSLADGTQAGTPVEVLLHSGTRIVFALLPGEEERVLVRNDLGVQYHLPADSAAKLLQLPAPDTAAGPDNATPAAPQ